MAKGFRRVDRDQQFLLPPDMREWLPEDHLAWFVIDAVGQLDLRELEARRRLGGVGRRGYDPRMMLTLLIYCYADGIRSSRRIERLCHTDVALRVICANDIPDHTTIARFRQDHQGAVAGLFGQVLAVCARAGLGRLGTIAIDGTKIAADAALAASRRREWFVEQAAAVLAEAAATDTAEDAVFGVDRRGDEPPGPLRGRADRLQRLQRCARELADEETAAEQEAHAAERAAAEQAARAAERLEAELTRRQQRIEAYRQARAAAAETGRARPRGRRVAEADRDKRVRAARKAVERAQGKAARAAEKTRRAAKAPRRNATDPDSRIMPLRGGGWLQGYNAQLAVAADGLILATRLVTDPNDVRQAQPMMHAAVTAARTVHTARCPAGTHCCLASGAGQRDCPHSSDCPCRTDSIGILLFDAGYWSEDNATANGPDRLIATGKGWKIHPTDDPATGPPPPRTDARARMHHRLRTPEGAALYKRRGATVEPANGHLKDRIGLRRFHRRGLQACQAELDLAGIALNIAKAFRTTRTAAVPA